jgi:kinesin family protein 2/24
MGNTESNPVKNLDKRTARRTYRDDFIGGIQRYRSAHSNEMEQQEEDEDWGAGAVKVVVRKRPIFKRETVALEFDCITCLRGQMVCVHDTRLHSDMKKELMHNNEFQFDRVFPANATNDDVYTQAASQLVREAATSLGFATCLMYGQTGSGKTYTMTAIYERAAAELFDVLPAGRSVSVSFFELAGDLCSDLLMSFQRANLMTASDGGVHPFPLVEVNVANAAELMAMVSFGFNMRSTAATGVHDASSRSHAILRIFVHDEDDKSDWDPTRQEGVLTLVDLAGSEHKIDSDHHTAQRRQEGAKINASLMALKSVVHAVAAGRNADHIYRKSKLTMALKSSFQSEGARTVVIATVSPARCIHTTPITVVHHTRYSRAIHHTHQTLSPNMILTPPPPPPLVRIPSIRSTHSDTRA